MQNLMAGKRGLIMGVANQKSIAYGIAENLKNAGAEFALSYAGETLKKRVDPIAEQLGCPLVFECDVTSDEAIEEAVKTVEKDFGKLDFIVHAIAFADKSGLGGKYYNAPRGAFLQAMDISCYSFTSICEKFEPLMNDNGSIITLSYLGGERVVPNYNLMGVAKAALEASVKYLACDMGERGIRVNSISAGPIKTLAASGIGEFRKVLNYNEANAPLRRNVDQDEVGRSAVALLSDLTTGITGENIHVDAGFHVMGMSKDLAVTA